jgi:hypothetical protein
MPAYVAKGSWCFYADAVEDSDDRCTPGRDFHSKRRVIVQHFVPKSNVYG